MTHEDIQKAPLSTAHPWHGIDPCFRADGRLQAFIEIVADGDHKMELDKATGLLRLDRPQRYSTRQPAMYGFIPQTYCGNEVARRSSEILRRDGIEGDRDPMDIVVLAERVPTQGGIIVNALPIGGLRMIDGGEADDKILAVLEGDPVYGACRQIGDIPETVIDRLVHYFTTYKQSPRDTTPKVVIEQMYDRDEAELMIRLSLADYSRRFDTPPDSGVSRETS